MDDLNCRLKIWVSWPFKNISLISIQSLIRGGRKLEYPGEKPLDLPVQNLISHMCPKQGWNHSCERSNI